MNYFHFYDLPESFLPDEKAIQTKYYALSREYHPDFYTLEPQEKQQEILEKSTLNTNAYRTLSNFDRRMQYILEQHGLLEEGGQNDLPQDFLMEVMELNEQLMELEMDYDSMTYKVVRDQTEQIEGELKAEIWPVLESYSTLSPEAQAEALKQVKNYYLKQRYLLRIKESLNKFASSSDE
ncbi:MULTISPECIES: iron-sulfur cluster co-chaperone HscB C-terminal domain-containing protein [Rufibacter]|uniref:Molecular chaperone HscB n=1 Tax=Rufibacter quisquiliarum TaxID=1549639 RepID=A0A839GD03_9BACT|nr:MULTISPECIES: iron-sulfur cluster co-chaperone HscB C-terminal domain-containing protein [Rufibacter]MBA9076270.1 molecular chaperone HscB [Rufibacter quisquiliarum]